MKRLKVLSDFDGTVVNILEDWCRQLRHYGYQDCYPDHIKVYNMVNNPCLAGVSEAELMTTLKRVSYFPGCSYTPWIAGVTAHLPQLAQQHDFTFVSCQPVDAKRQTANKQLRLRYLVPDAVVNYHADSKLRLDINADVFIDDRADSVWEWCKRHPNGLGLLMDAPYNSEAELPVNAARVGGWAGVTREIGVFAMNLERAELAAQQNAPAERPASPMLDLYPEDAAKRKMIPLYSGNLAYFPDSVHFLAKFAGRTVEHKTFKVALAAYSVNKNPEALAAAWYLLVKLHPEGEAGLDRDVAAVSYLGNQQHNPGQPLHWARGKSMDQLDAAARHYDEYRTGKRVDAAGYPVIGQAGWRVKAELQLRLEAIESAKLAGKETK